MKRFVAALILTVLFLAVGLLQTHAQDKPVAEAKHTVDFTQTLKALDGKPLLNADATGKLTAPMTLSDAVTTSLDTNFQDDKSGPEQVKSDKLAQRLLDCKSCGVSEDEATLILARVEKMQYRNARVYSEVMRILHPLEYDKLEVE